MKKTMVSLLSVSLLAIALLAGCAGTDTNRENTRETTQPTGILPDMEEILPDVREPDPRDGEVTDTDGRIEDPDDVPEAGRDSAGTEENTAGITGMQDR